MKKTFDISQMSAPAMPSPQSDDELIAAIEARSKGHNPCDCVSCIDPSADVRELLRIIKRQPAPVESGSECITLTGLQVNEIHAFTDGDSEFAVCIQYLPERTACNGEHMQAGLYVWSEDYPEEGVLCLEALPAVDEGSGNGHI